MRSGDLIDGRFELEKLAGAGGSGSVYRARDRASGERVALKLLNTDEGQRERFVREASILADLEHASIVRYVTHGISEDGAPYLAMEWLDGQTLSRALSQRERLLPVQALSLLLEACEALDIAHARGVIHRDVKPSNLFMVNDTERLKLLDFGLACAHRSIDTSTASGVAVGTPGYMAPEQVRGDGGIGPAADVFSLGCVLFECLTGRPAFGGRHTTAIFSKILMEPAPSLRSCGALVSPALDALVQRMLAKDPNQRPRNARALAEEVERLIERGERGVSGTVPPPSLTRREQGLLCVLMGRFGYEAAVAEAAHGSPRVAANQRLRALALRFGGHLDFMSNGVFVVVFRPDGEVTLAATDLANRAAQCALALHRVLPSAPLALGTGVGMASSASLIGDVIDRATLLLHSQMGAREAFRPDAALSSTLEEQLDGAEAAHTICVDAVTAGLLESRFDVITPGGPAGYLVGIKHERDAARPLLGKPTACVGREREISRLEALLDECSDEQSPRVVLITAAPGLGKSRVRHEFVRRVRERPRKVRVWQAWAEATRQGAPFELLAQIVRCALGLEEGEPPELARAKVRAGVEEAVGGSDAARVSAFLGELLGVGFGDSAQLASARREPRLMGDQIGRAWHDFLAGECARAPVLIVLEDVHWGDAGSLKWIDSALRHVEGRALFVLGLGRPHVTELFPGLWHGRGLVHVALRPLSRRASEELASAALGVPEDSAAVRRIVSRAEGNAFYLEELIRAEAEGRADVPGTVLAMVQARFARLAPAARQLLRAGSIFGESFWDEAVLALEPPGTPAALHGEQLRALVQAEWLIKKSESRLARQAEYAFQHALLRDAAYASLTDDDRRLGHALAGAWLERNRERDPLTLAEHFKHGGELPRAASWYERAAALALKGDLGGAIEHAERAVQCGASGAMLGRLRLIQAEAQNWRGEHEGAARTAAEALQQLEPSGSDAERWAHAVNQCAWANGYLGNHAEVTRWARSLFEHSRERSTDLHIVALAFCAMHLIDGGSIPDAELISSWLRARAAEGIEDPLASAAVNQLIGHKNLSEDLCEALRRYEAASRDLQRAEDERQLQTTIETAGVVYLMLGQYERAESAFRSSLAIADRLGAAREASLGNLALVRARLGAVAEGRELLLQSLGGDRDQAAKIAGYLHATLADVEIAAGRYEAALTHARFGVSVDNRPLQAYALSLSSRAELGLGHPDRALEYASAAVALADSIVPIQEYEPLARLAYADARMACGDHAAARLAIRAARDAVNKRAAYLDEPELRHGFLTRVPENSRILALARAWLGE